MTLKEPRHFLVYADYINLLDEQGKWICCYVKAEHVLNILELLDYLMIL
jgi:hypothetical protein